MSSTKTTLSKKTAVYLRSLLNTLGWVTATDQAFRASEFTCEILPSFKDAPPVMANGVPVDREAYDKWGSEEVEVEIPDPHFEVIQFALRHYGKEGKLSPGSRTLELLRAFRLSPK